MQFSTAIKYVTSLLKRYQNLQQLVQPQAILRIAAIESSFAHACVFKVQVVGKSTLFDCTPQEIVTNDQLLDSFSKQDVRTITYYATLAMHQPRYKILAQDFCEDDHKVVFKLAERGCTKLIKKTAAQISLDKNLLDQLTQSDAHKVGYVASAEKITEESNQISNLKKL